MVESSPAEEKKNQGNEALKAGNLDEAITLYTEAIGKHPITNLTLRTPEK